MTSIIIFIRNTIQNLLLTLVSIIRIPFFARPWGFVSNKNPDKPLIILSNGPSLNKSLDSDYEKLDSYDLMAVNMFVVSDYFLQLKPSYYVVVSPDMWDDDSDPRLKEKKERLWLAISNRTSWNMTIVLPAEAKSKTEWKELVKKNTYLSFLYFNRTPIEGFKIFTTFCFRYSLGIARPHNVLIPSLFAAINLGYKSIFILGADHSWLPEVTVNEQNEVLVNQKHFYDETTSKPALMTKRGGNRRLHEILHKWYLSFAAYFIIQAYAQKQNCVIYNSTPTSFIDAFERRAIP